jgi:hypothetical protein
MSDFYQAKWKAETKPWRLSVLENYLQRPGGVSSLEMLVAIEDYMNVHPDGKGRGVLRQLKPGFKWFELKAGAPGGRFGLRWENAGNYPAPAWSFNVEAWPGTVDKPALPQLDAWWIRSDTPDPDQILEHKDPKIPFEKEFQDRPTRVDQVKVRIESVTVEERIPDGSSQPIPCLVVRLRHDPKNIPVWVQLKGLRAKSEEHRFYAQAGKVTAIFQDVTQDSAQQHGFALNLISLAAFKEKAERTGYHVDSQQLKLPPPDTLQNRPEPVKLSRTGG